MKPERYRAILWGGLVAGILDLTAAISISVWFGRTPVQLLQLVASGLLGADAYAGGLSVAFLGGLLHFAIAFSAATVYYLMSRRLRVLTERPLICGILYGIAVYHFMNQVVLPLSAYPHPIAITPASYLRGILVHMFCVGLPIAIGVSRYSRNTTRQKIVPVTS